MPAATLVTGSGSAARTPDASGPRLGIPAENRPAGLIAGGSRPLLRCVPARYLEGEAMEFLRAGCASLIGLVFLASAVSKLRDFGEFRRSLPILVPVGRGAPGLLGPLAALVVGFEAAVPALL